VKHGARMRLSFERRSLSQCYWSLAAWQFDSDFVVYNIDEGEWNKPTYRALVPENE
jgi:hypothetical protein